MDEVMREALANPELVELAADLVEDDYWEYVNVDGYVTLNSEEFEALCLLTVVGLEAVAREKAKIVESN